MSLLEEKKTAGYTVIIGCGRLGANIANTLSDEGGDVLIIDRDEGASRRLSPSFGGLVVTGDGMDFDVLQEAQIEKADAALIVTNNDNTNAMIAQIVREIFKVERVIARLYDPDREDIYREFGIDTICPAVLSAKEIERILTRADKSAETAETVSVPSEEIK